MRMWMVPTRILCRKHLMGEHVECHMFLGTLKKGKSMQGYFDNNLFEPVSLFARHWDLAWEMISRGYNHNSPLDQMEVNSLIYALPDKRVIVSKSLEDLVRRCPRCNHRFVTGVSMNQVTVEQVT